MNFLVVIIISIVILGFGTKFIMDIVGGGNDIKDITMEDLDDRIDSLLCSGSERVCFGFDKQTIKRGDFGTLGVDLTNIMGEEKTFSIVSEESQAFDKNGNIINLDSISCVPESCIRTINLENLEENKIALGFLVDKNAMPGKYIYNVAICTSGTDLITLEEDTQKCSKSTCGMGVYGFNKIIIEVP